MTNVCLPGQRCASRKGSLPLPAKTRILALAARGAPLAHLQWTEGKDTMAYFLGNQLPNPKVGGKNDGRERRFDSGNYDLLTFFFSFL